MHWLWGPKTVSWGCRKPCCSQDTFPFCLLRISPTGDRKEGNTKTYQYQEKKKVTGMKVLNSHSKEPAFSTLPKGQGRTQEKRGKVKQYQKNIQKTLSLGIREQEDNWLLVANWRNVFQGINTKSLKCGGGSPCSLYSCRVSDLDFGWVNQR